MEENIKIPDVEKYELKKVAEKSIPLAALLGFFLSPLGYVYLGKWKWAVINFFTFNYLLLGFLIVPFHTFFQIKKARERLDQAGVDWGSP